MSEEMKMPIPELGGAVVESGGKTLYQCMQCGLCTASCPWRLVEGPISREFNTRKVQHMGQLGLEGYESDNILFACTTCGVCKVRCPREADAIQNMRVLRSMLAQAGSVPNAYKPVIGSLNSNGNPWQGAREQRNDWTEGLDIPAFTEGTEYLLFVCCTSCYDARSRKIAKAVASLLKKAGISFGVLGNEQNCCGESVRKLGGEETFQLLAEKNIDLFNSKGVKKIITTSPHCLYAFRDDYAELDAHYEVLHYTQVLEKAMGEGKLKTKSKLDKRIIFHDPCYLGRHSEIYSAPRNILDEVSTVEHLEMDRFGVDSICCGGGGGRIWMETAPGERFADLRVSDAVAKKADVIATSCPYCTIMVDSSNMAMGKEEIQVLDVAELLDQTT